MLPQKDTRPSTDHRPEVADIFRLYSEELPELGSDQAICLISIVCRPKYNRFQALEDRF